MPSVTARAATDPDVRQQAPFEVGDAITFAGTLIPATPATATAAAVPAYISAHTVEANVGIFTMPGTQPSYLAIGQFGVGTADPALVSINGAVAETKDRIFLESETTDVSVTVPVEAVPPITLAGLKETALAAGAGYAGVTALDAAEAGPVPTALVAMTLSVTPVPLVRPVTVAVVTLLATVTFPTTRPAEFSALTV